MEGITIEFTLPKWARPFWKVIHTFGITVKAYGTRISLPIVCVLLSAVLPTMGSPPDSKSGEHVEMLRFLAWHSDYRVKQAFVEAAVELSASDPTIISLVAEMAENEQRSQGVQRDAARAMLFIARF